MRNIINKHRRRVGFTLIELLVVIGIISLLLGIALPGLSRARQIARRTACASNLRQIGLGFQMYLDDNRGVLPPAAQQPSVDIEDRKPITHFILPGEAEVFRCPADLRGEYFQRETSSYEYWFEFWQVARNMMLSMRSGRIDLASDEIRVAHLPNELGFAERDIWIMSDYENFHGESTQTGGKNYLFINGGVRDLRKEFQE